MLTPRENFLETIKIGGKPDRLVDDYEPFQLVGNDPCYRLTRGNRQKGKTTKDVWGVEYAWPESQLYPFPTEHDKVCPDILEWKKTVKVPDLIGTCSDPALWKDAQEAASKIDRKEKLVMGFMGTGVFEQAHNLMGIADICIAIKEEPEAAHELLAAIGEFKFNYAKLLVDNLHPDVIISHDDWGNKHSLFMSPADWREFIKPHYVKMYGYMRDHGVIILHHADSYCEPIIEDMVELGIHVWQGVLNTNNIPAMQKKLAGRMTLMGGLDSIIDRADSKEEEIRADVRKVCELYGPGGHFFPSITYGLPGTLYPHVDPIIHDEIRKYNKEVYGV